MIKTRGCPETRESARRFRDSRGRDRRANKLTMETNDLVASKFLIVRW